MCGIVGYVGKKQASPLLYHGLECLEYRGYDSAGIAVADKDIITTGTNFEFPDHSVGHVRWALENLKYGKNFPELKYPRLQAKSMDMLTLIKKENYYALLDTRFQKSLRDRIKKTKFLYRKLGISQKTLSRIPAEGNWGNIGTLFDLVAVLRIDERELRKNIIQIKTKNSFPLTPSNIDLTPSLARVLGHILGDGGIHIIEKEGKYRAFYVNNDRRLLSSFKSDIEGIFGCGLLYFRERIGHGDEIWIPSTLGYIFYKLLEYDKNSEKRVPMLVNQTKNKKIIEAFLQALYDDEGFLYPKKYLIVISLANRPLLEDIRRLVIKLRINPNPIRVHRSKNRSQMYYFSITGKMNILAFNRCIGFIHPLKSDKLHQLINSYR